MGPSAKGAVRSEASPRWRPVFLAVLGVAIVAGSALLLGAWVRSERRRAIESWEGRLTAMGDDREMAIESWLRERWGDARVVASNPAARALGDPGGGPGNRSAAAEAGGDLSAVLHEIVSTYGYVGAYVLDGDGRLVAASPGAPELHPECRAWALGRTSALPEGIRFFLGPTLESSEMAFSHEIRPVDPTGTGARRPARVVLSLRPAQWLFPMLAKEPLSTRTGETTVALRDGDELVYISPLRHRPGRAAPLRVRAKTPQLPSSAAAQGERAFGEFVDYRGVPVLAVTRPIEKTDIALVVKVDLAEVLAPFRRAMLLQGLALAAVVGMVAAGGAGLWRDQRVRRLSAVLAERRRSEGRILELNRLLQTIYEVNHVVVREGDREKLLEDSCRSLVRQGHFVMAWVGFAGEDGRVAPATRAGCSPDYLDGLTIRWDDAPEGRGPTGTAIREDRHVVNPDVETTPEMAPWRDRALRAGFRASAAFPIRIRGRAVGALSVYKTEPDSIGEEEIALLESLAGDIGHALEALRDREDRAAAEEALRESENRFKYVFEHSVIGKSITLPGGELSVNQAFADMLGYTREELQAKRWQEITHPDDVEPTQREVDALALSERDTIRLEKRYSHRNGSVVWVDMSCAVRRDAGHRPVYFVTDVVDITDRKRAEEALRLGEERYRALAESVTEAVYAFDSGLRYTYWNPGSERMTGIPASQALGKSLYELFPGARGQAGERLYLEVLRTGSPGSVTVEYPLDDGFRAYEIDCYPSHDGLTVIARDITERRRAEEEMRRLNEELESRVAARTSELESVAREMEAFSYSVSHDLRAPVRAIDGFARLLADHLRGSLDGEGTRLLGTIRTNTRRMSELIDGLLRLSRASRAEMRSAHVDMAAVAREVLAEIVPNAERVEVRLSDLPPAVGDESLLRVVLQNLVSNAVKYSGRREHPVIEVGYRSSPEGPEYFVRDNGAGFDPQYGDRLFGVFQRLHGAAEFEGTGIGLALVKRVVERHGGRTWAEGEVDRGATFWFTLGTTPADRPSPLVAASP